VAGGDRVHYPEDASTPTSGLLTVKILLNSIISTPNAKFISMDMKDFYLNTPMARYKYMRLQLLDMPEDVITQYKLNKIATPEGFIYCKIQKGMYGLPQAGIIAQQLLEKRLEKDGYCQSTTTLMTSRKCEVAYYIMWSVLLKARQDVQRKIDTARVAGLSDKAVYQMEARLNAMSNVKGTGSIGDKTFAALGEHAKQSHEEHMHIEEILGRIEGKIDVLKTDVNVVKAKKGGSRSGHSSHSGSGYVKTGLSEIRRLFTRA
jgi:hypothetical protein